MRAVTVCAALCGMVGVWSDASEDRMGLSAPSPATLSVYGDLADPGPLVLYSTPGASAFTSPAVPPSLQPPRSIILNRQFHLGGVLPLQTRFLFLPEERPKEEDPLLRFQQRMRRNYGSPEEDRWTRSALQIGLEEKGRAGGLTASLVTVGTEFEQDQEHGLERGTQRLDLAGQYALHSNLSLGTAYTRTDRAALGPRTAATTESWRNQAQFRPSASSRVQVIQERTRTQEDRQPAHSQETVKFTGEQKIGERATLTLGQEREYQQGPTRERRETETTAQLEWEPSRQVEIDLERKREQVDDRDSETTHAFEVRYKPTAPLSVKALYTQQDKGDRQKQEREFEIETRPDDDWKVIAGWEQERQRGEREDTHSLKIEATPGDRTNLTAGYEEEEKSGGRWERTQTAALEFQATAALSLNGSYRETDERHGSEKTRQTLAVTNRFARWLTVTGAEELQRQEGRPTDRLQRVGAESAWGAGVSLALTQEWREKQAGEWQVRSTSATYQPSEALQFSGRHTIHIDPTHQTIRSHQADFDVTPRSGWRLQGRLAENPEDPQGRVTPGTQQAMQMQVELSSGLSLNGRTARHEGATSHAYRRETEWGLSLGSDLHRLFTQVKKEQTLSLGYPLSTEYRLGYSRRLNSRLSWSLEGALQRREEWYGSVGRQQEEYRGEAKVNLSF